MTEGFKIVLATSDSLSGVLQPMVTINLTTMDENIINMSVHILLYVV